MHNWKKVRYVFLHDDSDQVWGLAGKPVRRCRDELGGPPEIGPRVQGAGAGTGEASETSF